MWLPDVIFYMLHILGYYLVFYVHLRTHMLIQGFIGEYPQLYDFTLVALSDNQKIETLYLPGQNLPSYYKWPKPKKFHR